MGNTCTPQSETGKTLQAWIHSRTPSQGHTRHDCLPWMPALGALLRSASQPGISPREPLSRSHRNQARLPHPPAISPTPRMAGMPGLCPTAALLISIFHPFARAVQILAPSLNETGLYLRLGIGTREIPRTLEVNAGGPCPRTALRSPGGGRRVGDLSGDRNDPDAKDDS